MANLFSKSNSSTLVPAQRCHGCDLTVEQAEVLSGYVSSCPRCGTTLQRGKSVNLNGNLAIAVAALLLFIPSHFFPLMTIDLFGVMIPATLPSGTITLMTDGFPLLGLLILLCSSIAPFLVCSSVLTAHWATRYNKFLMFKYSMFLIERFRGWVMLDVFLVGLAISAIKMLDVADIYVGTGLSGLILLQLVTSLLLTRIHIQQYWNNWQAHATQSNDAIDMHCLHCHLSQPHNSHCIRCHTKLIHRKKHSVQKTWACLIAATISLFPANFFAISIFFNHGKRVEDTIFSGVVSLIRDDMSGIAAIIFIASIIVPVTKILGLSYILLCIQFKRSVFHRQRMFIYSAVKWIGKWSVMDLFVISIMMALIDRGQILDFTPGSGAIAFAFVVVLTMLATESLDSRLIWENYEQSEPSR
ncbi:MAG: paraquat-inducible protein A [Aliivibrio sp.]|uniref:PqiA/YebS family transporter subunit n=1 Tax=Aliivibrio sp. TaxID=1872443 RepID=UPI001A603812|nr:paraquat-inducible protein A [Aliivibrio sp.]